VHDDDGARAELATGLAAWTVWAGHDRRETTPTSTTDPQTDILEMARRGAAAFTGAPSIMTIHAVTAPMAYLLLADHLDVATHRVALSVFERTHRRHATPPARPVDRPAPGPAELATLTQRWDAHPAKLVEAALRGYARRGDAVFLDAVATMMA
jgi:hypothetical protein